MRRAILILTAVCLLSSYVHSHDLEEPIIPEDQLGYFDLRGPVAEVVEEDGRTYQRTIWRFDVAGRIVEYLHFSNPFSGDGGCIFRLTDHYRYAYSPSDGSIQYLYTYNEEYTLVDAYADEILPLFPSAPSRDEDYDKAAGESGDSSYCFSRQAAMANGKEYYYAKQYDRYRNRIAEVWVPEYDAERGWMITRTIRYYTDRELMGLAQGIRSARYETRDKEGTWRSDYYFAPTGKMVGFQSYKDLEPLYDWHLGQSDAEATDLMPADPSEETPAAFEYWGDINMEAFHMVVGYGEDEYECAVWPLPGGYWLALNHWSIAEEESGMSALGEGPFVERDTAASFLTRNYGGKALPVYASCEGKKIRKTIRYECSGVALSADPKTRRVLCRLTPLEGDQGEMIEGWIDEEWVCANTLTTCP